MPQIMQVDLLLVKIAGRRQKGGASLEEPGEEQEKVDVPRRGLIAHLIFWCTTRVILTSSSPHWLHLHAVFRAGTGLHPLVIPQACALISTVKGAIGQEMAFSRTSELGRWQSCG